MTKNIDLFLDNYFFFLAVPVKVSSLGKSSVVMFAICFCSVWCFSSLFFCSSFSSLFKFFIAAFTFICLPKNLFFSLIGSCGAGQRNVSLHEKEVCFCSGFLKQPKFPRGRKSSPLFSAVVSIGRCKGCGGGYRCVDWFFSFRCSLRILM